MGKRFFKHPWIIIVTALVITAGFATQLGKLEIDNSLRIYLPVEHESYVRLEEMEAEFGSTDIIGIVLEAREGSILTADYVNLLRDITERIEDVLQVDEVTSLANIDYIYGRDGSLIAGSLVGDDFAGTPAELRDIREKIAGWDDMYHRVIISDDWKSTQMSVTLETGLGSKEKQAALDAVRLIVAETAVDPNIKVTYVGDPVVSESAGQFMRSDMARLIPLVVLVVIICLFLSFGSVEGTVLPLITVLLSSIWSLGIMGMLNVTFTIVSSVIPVALIAIGSAYGIHVMNHYYAALDKEPGPVGRERHREIILKGLTGVLPAVILAAVTTVAGFISLVGSPLVPLRSFSVFTALGIVFSLLLSISFIPALLMVKPEKSIGRRSGFLDGIKAKLKAKGTPAQTDTAVKTEAPSKPSILYRLYRILAGSPVRLVLFSMVIIAVSAFGIRRITVDTALVNYFPADSQVRQDIDFVDERFAGTNSIYLIVEGQEKGDMTRPEILKPLDELQTHLSETYGEIGKTVSFSTFVKRMNQVMHIPENPAVYETNWEDDFSGDKGLESFGFSSFDDSGSGLSSFDDEFSFGGDDDWSGTDDGYIDPNIAYATKLGEPMTFREGMALLEKAYSTAGGSAATVQGIVRELEKELNYNGAAYYEIPYDPAKYPAATTEELQDLVSQYLLLFSGSLDNFIDDSLVPRTGRVAIQLRTRSTTVIEGIINDAEAYAAAHFPEGYTVHATGNAQLEYVMTELIISSQMRSLLFSLVSVFLILAIYFRSPLAGLVGAVPLLFAILLNYMAMGIFNINLDMFTSLIASIAVGVGIDYTIHFMTNYREERQLSGNLQEVTRKTLEKSGRGIVTNALSVGLGFLVLCLSRFVVLRYIGILVAVVMFTSSVLAMTVIPGLLNIFDFKFMKRKKNRPEEA
ncbi:efflux RND transporter permease subunit [Breznakiella homolactica]|uniref:RND family transporter n=1 Tax=Breznakiella homolactica TaxID=2798577 RepID=A0A7T7XK48_9SPIR|nr:MMPL family transporter [Breznakiella homolactica]QQO07890.1 MMPL family transporter [Breznakiella homolactica]